LLDLSAAVKLTVHSAQQRWRRRQRFRNCCPRP